MGLMMHLDIPRKSFLSGIAPGESGTRQTLRLMRQYVQQYKKAGLIRDAAVSLIAHLRPKDWISEISALHAYVRDHIRYTKDIHGVETLQTPLVTLDNQVGDCDDKSTLLASLLESVGHPTRFIAAGYKSPGSYSHVYVETRVGNRWIPLDPTMAYPIGRIPAIPVARMVVHN